VRGEPRTRVHFDAVDERDGFAYGERGDREAQPRTRELTVEQEPAGVGLPGVGEDIECFMETQLGMGVAMSRGMLILGGGLLGDLRGAWVDVQWVVSSL